MTIQVEWDNEQHTIVRWTLHGRWTWEEFRAAQAELHGMIRHLDHPVDLIADMHDAPSVPEETFRNFKNAERHALPNRDRVVLVGASLLVRGMAATFNQVFRNRPTFFLLADSLDQARALLAQPRTRRQQNVSENRPETLMDPFRPDGTYEASDSR